MRGLIILISIILTSCATNRYALVMANADYVYNNELQDLGSVPEKDAQAIGNKLSDLGFMVYELNPNLTQNQMLNAIENFAEKLRLIKGKGEIGVVYYSGHGTEIEGTTYLVPVDAHSSKQIDQLIPLDKLVYNMDKWDGRSDKIIILNACQDDGTGMINKSAKPIPSSTTLIAYASLPGQTASNKATEDGTSLYTALLLEALDNQDMTANDVFNEAEYRVAELSDREHINQQPYHSQSGPLDFIFNPSYSPKVPHAGP